MEGVTERAAGAESKVRIRAPGEGGPEGEIDGKEPEDLAQRDHGLAERGPERGARVIRREERARPGREFDGVPREDAPAMVDSTDHLQPSAFCIQPSAGGPELGAEC